MLNERDDLSQLLESAAEGNQSAFGELLSRNRSRLQHSVRMRMDCRIRARVDPLDVIQEAFVEASLRFGEYIKNPSVTFLVWFRYLGAQRLQMLHRNHLGVQARDARREVSLCTGNFSEAESKVLAV